MQGISPRWRSAVTEYDQLMHKPDSSECGCPKHILMQQMQVEWACVVKFGAGCKQIQLIDGLRYPLHCGTAW